MPPPLCCSDVTDVWRKQPLCHRAAHSQHGAYMPSSPIVSHLKKGGKRRIKVQKQLKNMLHNKFQIISPVEGLELGRGDKHIGRAGAAPAPGIGLWTRLCFGSLECKELLFKSCLSEPGSPSKFFCSRCFQLFSCWL